MIDCRDCKHATQGYSQLLCRERHPVMSADWRRDPRCECGSSAVKFEPKGENHEASATS